MKITHPKLQTQLSFLILFLPLIFQGQNVWNPVGPFENNLSNNINIGMKRLEDSINTQELSGKQTRLVLLQKGKKEN